MKVTALKTDYVEVGDDIFMVLEQFLPKGLPEQSVVVITSKIIALCESNIVALEDVAEKHDLTRQEAEYFTDPGDSDYNVMLTVKDGILAVNAGVDESNVKEAYVLLPKDSYDSAQRIWEWLRNHYGVQEVGVVVTDSTSMPLKWGTVGRCLAYCGFEPLKNLIGTPDLVGRLMKMTKMNVAEGLAAAAVLEMGEGAESTPLALVEDVTHITFSQQPPTPQEIQENHIDIKDDVYAPLLKVFTKRTQSGK